MTLDPFIDALGLPPGARVNQRVPKKLLLDHGAPTPADKRQIQDGIEEASWVAALKPNNIGVPAFKDEVREYLEIAVLAVGLRDPAKATRLTELIHRAIPYPVVLWAGQGGGVRLSLAHKRRSHGQAGEVVVEEVRRTEALRSESLTAHESAFLESLALSRLPVTDLFALYQGLIDRMATLEAATVTGSFTLPKTTADAAALHDALAARGRLQREIATLRAQAGRERQMSRRADLNLVLRRLESELAAALKSLEGVPNEEAHG